MRGAEVTVNPDFESITNLEGRGPPSPKQQRNGIGLDGARPSRRVVDQHAHNSSLAPAPRRIRSSKPFYHEQRSDVAVQFSGGRLCPGEARPQTLGTDCGAERESGSLGRAVRAWRAYRAGRRSDRDVPA